VGLLVRVRPDHDHVQRPFVWLTTDEADFRRTNVTRGGMPRSYQVTPKVLGRRRATRAKPVRPDRSTVGLRVSSPPARGDTGRVGRHRLAASGTMTVTLDSADLWSEPQSHWISSPGGWSISVVVEGDGVEVAAAGVAVAHDAAVAVGVGRRRDRDRPVEGRSRRAPRTPAGASARARRRIAPAIQLVP